MTNEQIKRFLEIEQIKFKGYQEWDEIAELKKGIKFSDILMIEWFRNSKKEIPTSASYQLIKKYVGKAVQCFIKDALATGFVRQYSFRSHSRDNYGIELNKKGEEIFKKHLTSIEEA